MKTALLIISIILFGCYGKQPTTKTGLEGVEMPSFNILLTDSVTKLNTNSIPSGKSSVFIFINPNCPFCRAMTEDITKNIRSLNDIQFYFLSVYPVASIKQYSEMFHLDQYSNISIGRDYEDYFGKYFSLKGVPFTAVYGKDKRLKQALVGKVNHSQILKSALE